MPRILQFDGSVVDFADLANTVNFSVDNIVNCAYKVCRFNGQTKFFYSNLRHMLECSCLCKNEELKLACLLHDVHEIVIGDFLSPVVAYLGPNVKEIIDELKYELDTIVAKQFNCPELLTHKVDIKYFDQQMTNIEAYDLLNKPELLFEAPELDYPPLLYLVDDGVIELYKSKLQYLIRKNERSKY